jgi:hypothetical protein
VTGGGGGDKPVQGGAEATGSNRSGVDPTAEGRRPSRFDRVSSGYWIRVASCEDLVLVLD